MTTIVRELDRCIFCDGRDMTEEHLIADWAHRAFAKSRKPTNQLRGTWVAPERLAVSTDDPVMTAKVICRSCNNKWLSGLDNDAARVLRPLIRGEREVALDAAGQTAVAAWIYKSALIFDAAEHGRNSELASLRAGFMTSRQAGPGCIIYAGPATPPPLVEAGSPPVLVRFWLLGIRPAVGTMRVVINVVSPDNASVTPRKPLDLPIPGYQIMVGALWAYIGGQVSPVAAESLQGFRQLWPAQDTPVTLRAASLADPSQAGDS